MSIAEKLEKKEVADETLPFYCRLLRQELKKRQAKNPSYSSRRFSDQLGISPALCTRILKLQRRPSLRNLESFSNQLKWSNTQREMAFQSLIDSSKLKPNSSAREHDRTLSTVDDWLDQKTFQIVSQWQHFAALELADVDGKTLNAASVSQEFDLPVAFARDVLERLCLAGVLERKSDGSYKKRSDWVHTQGRAATSDSHRMLVKSLLEKSIEHVDETSWGKRLNYWGMYAIAPEDIPLVQPMIEKFMVEVGRVLSRRKRTEVYTAGFYLCPVKSAAFKKQKSSD